MKSILNDSEKLKQILSMSLKERDEFCDAEREKIMQDFNHRSKSKRK